MKINRVILSLSFLAIYFSGYAQDPNRKHSIGLYQSFTDYNVVLLQDKIFAFDSALSQSTRLAYQRRLSRTFMLNAGISNGFILNQNIRESFIEKAYVMGLDAAVFFKLNNGRIMKENPFIAPYLTFGYRMDYIPKLRSIEEKPYLFLNQYGFGFNIKLSERTHIQLQTVLDQKLSSNFNTHLQYRMGIVQSLGPLEDKPSKKDPKIDTDMDGIVDVFDNCPTIFGSSETGGCPDSLWAKANNDSLERIVVDQRAELDKLQMELAKLRNADVNDSSASREQELLLQIYKLRKSKDEEIMALKKQLENKNNEALNNSQEQLLAEKLRKQQEEKAQLEKELAASKSKEKSEKTVETIQESSIEDYPPIPEDKNYYVITISSPNIATSQKWLVKFKKDYVDAVILPQPSGFYRVGIYAGKDRPKALRIMDEVRKLGYEQVWLSVE